MKQTTLPIYVKLEITQDRVIKAHKNTDDGKVYIQDIVEELVKNHNGLYELFKEGITQFGFIKVDGKRWYCSEFFQEVPTAWEVHISQAKRFDKDFPYLDYLSLKGSLVNAFKSKPVDYLYIFNSNNRVCWKNKELENYHIIEDYAEPLVEEKPIPENHIRIDGIDYNCKPSPEECFGVPCLLFDNIKTECIFRVNEKLGQVNEYKPVKHAYYNSYHHAFVFCLPITGKLMDKYKQENGLK
jgi:hypothetical protein